MTNRYSSLPVWPRLLIAVQLLVLLPLLMRKDVDPVPVLTELERATGTLEQVAARCATDVVGGGPATLTLCGLDLAFGGGSLSTAVYPYGRLSSADARDRRDALTPLRGQTMDLWLLRSNANPEAPPVIWQMNHNGEPVIRYTDVAEYNANMDSEFARTFGIAFVLFCLLESLAAVYARRNIVSSFDGPIPASLRRMEGGFDAMMLIGLCLATYFAFTRESGTASIIVLLCALVSVLGWFLRTDGGELGPFCRRRT